ncbi:MAG: WbqC family protein [Candidatus Omnitrophica bacterium]|nr:WbqC family protein [Candidatus Omnitrophota bacterium]
MIVGVHQPEHLPWLGFFDKMDQCDIFVILDTVQYRKNYFQNRNKIRVASGEKTWAWLTVPIVKGSHTQLIRDVKISSDRDWRKKHLALIRLSYDKAPFFKRYIDVLMSIYEKEHSNLAPLNIELISAMQKLLGINTEVLVASQLGTGEGSKGGTMVTFNICKHLKATEYMSGAFGKDYLDEDVFKAGGVSVRYQEFHHPVYRQLYEPFAPEMSCIDLLFNEGDSAINIIREANNRG